MAETLSEKRRRAGLLGAQARWGHGNRNGNHGNQVANDRPWRSSRPVAQLRQGSNDWFQISNQANGSVLAMIYDEVGYFGITAQDFVTELNRSEGPVDLRLNSPGGDVFEGLAIYNALKSRGDISVYIDGLAASIASVIAMAADPGQLAIASTASMMIHDGFGMGIGTADDMRKLAAVLDIQSDNIADIYADRTGQDASHWRALMRDETWFKGQKAVDAGLADTLAGPGSQSTNQWDLSIFGRMDNAAYDDSPWDGNAAMSSCSSASDYRSICAGEHSAGSPDERQHWALPHHKSPGAQPNRAGVNDALSRLPQTQDLTNRSAAEAHLQAHARLWADSGSNHAHDDIQFDWADLFTSAAEEALS